MRKILVMLVSILIISCNDASNEIKDYLGLFVNDKEFKNKEIIVVLPLVGCHSCIEETIEILNNSINSDKITVIFSSFDKSLRQKYISRLDKNILYFEDKEETLTNYNLGSTNDPALFFLKNGKITNRIDYNVSLGKQFLQSEISLFWTE